VSSRKEEKERLRQERLAREQAAADAAARRRRLQLIGGGALVVALVVVIVVVVAASGGGSSKQASAGSGASAGLQTTPAPWAPEYGSLGERLNALKLPAPSDTVFHIHALLRVFVNGKREPVPANIGIDQADQILAPLHTHDASGIVHIESVTEYPFTLGQFFTVWGVKFTDTQIGAYRNADGHSLSVFVNGKRVSDPVKYVMKPHDSIIVGYGKPGSFPTKLRARFPNGL
jgi:hypothetical protein